MIPQWYIDKLKQNINIIDLVSEYTTLKKSSKNIYIGHCPNPKHKDSDPSFRVWKDTQTWACMGCHYGKKNKKNNLLNEENYGSDCIAFIRWIKQCSWLEAITYLSKKYDMPIPTDKNQALYRYNKNITKIYHNSLSKESMTYLQKRGLSQKDINEWLIGFDGLKIVFPLIDRYSNVLGFTRRWLNSKENVKDKYRNSRNNEIFDKSKYLYGIQNIDEDFKELRITEGTMDVILSSKYGAKNVVATLGTAFSSYHIDLIKRYNMTPVFCLDGDKAGLTSAKKNILLLAEANIYSKIVIFPDNKDFAEISLDLKDNIESYIEKNSITYGNYILKNLLDKYTSELNELKLKYYPDLLKLLMKVPTQDERVILKNHIKNIMQLNL